MAALLAWCLLWAALGLGVLWALLWEQASDVPKVIDSDTTVAPGLLSAAAFGTATTIGGVLIGATLWGTQRRFAPLGLGVAALGVCLAAPGWDTFPESANLEWTSLVGLVLPLVLLSSAGLWGHAPSAAHLGLLHSPAWRIIWSTSLSAAGVAGLVSVSDGVGMGLVYQNAEEESGWLVVFFSTMVTVICFSLATACAKGSRTSTASHR